MGPENSLDADCRAARQWSDGRTMCGDLVRKVGEFRTRGAALLLATFEALRSGGPARRVYEGMEAAAEGLTRFEREHSGHQLRQAMVGNDVIVTRCLDCDCEFQEHYSREKPSRED